MAWSVRSRGPPASSAICGRPSRIAATTHWSFEIPVENAGDGYARLRILFAEARQSVRLIEQAVATVACRAGGRAARMPQAGRGAGVGGSPARRCRSLAANRRGCAGPALPDHAAVLHELARISIWRRRISPFRIFPSFWRRSIFPWRKTTADKRKEWTMAGWVLKGLTTGTKTTCYPAGAERTRASRRAGPWGAIIPNTRSRCWWRAARWEPSGKPGGPP